MKRDFGNEFIVAIGAVGILAFAITFAVILALSGGTAVAPTATAPVSNSTNLPTLSSQATNTTTVGNGINATNTSLPEVTPAPEIIETSPAISATATNSANAQVQPTTIELSATPLLPTHTSVPATTIPSATSQPVTLTPRPTQTLTLVPSNTSRPNAAATSTSTTSPTQTPIRASATPVPSNTARPTATATAIPPTATITPSHTPSPTYTATYTPTKTPTVTPSRTSTPTATRTPTRTPTATATATWTPRPTEPFGIFPTATSPLPTLPS